jgi:hypothetical protein
MESESKLPAERLVSACINISQAGESPEEAIVSVLESSHLFADLHLVKKSYSTKDNLYPTWHEDQARLKELGIDVIWHSEFDPRLLKTRALVHIEPDLSILDGAFNTLTKDMDEYPNCDHFAVSSVTVIDPSPPLEEEGRKKGLWWISRPFDLIQSFSYGFLLVIMMLDSLRSILSLFQYHRKTDLRGQLVVGTWPNRVRMAPERNYMWWFGTGRCWTRRGGGACVQRPGIKDQGIAFVLRTINTHSYMGIGIWLLGYALFYACFALPFWNTFLNPYSRLGAWLVRDVFHNIFWQLWYLAYVFVTGYMAWQYMDFPLLSLQVLLAPVYVTLSPLIFFYGRFHTSRASWQRKK